MCGLNSFTISCANTDIQAGTLLLTANTANTIGLGGVTAPIGGALILAAPITSGVFTCVSLVGVTTFSLTFSTLTVTGVGGFNATTIVTTSPSGTTSSGINLSG